MCIRDSLFSSNSTLDDSGIPHPPPSPLRFPMPLPVITFDRVHVLLKSMNVRKAGGPDGIPPRVLRECASALSPPLVQLYSLCLNTSTFPQCWKAHMSNLFRKKEAALILLTIALYF